MPTKKAPPKTVDDYIAAAPKEERATLMKLRLTIKAAAPKATESVSYGMVGYKQNGKRLVYFAYWNAYIALRDQRPLQGSRRRAEAVRAE